jgi:hypothetical protein
VLAEPHNASGADDLRKGGFARDQRRAPQVIAIQVKEIKGVEIS